jgi:integration host factor subunit alpha
MKLDLDSIDLTSLTKADLGAVLFEQLGVNKREAGDLVDAFFEIITDRLAAGEEVKLADFAGFQVRKKAPRPGRNPRTGEEVQIAGRRVVTFQSGPKLKARLKNGTQPAPD